MTEVGTILTFKGIFLFHIIEMELGSKVFIRVMGGHGLKDAVKIPLVTDTKIQ